MRYVISIEMDEYFCGIKALESGPAVALPLLSFMTWAKT